MTISIETRKKPITSDSNLHCTHSQSVGPGSSSQILSGQDTEHSPDTLQKMITSIVIKTGGVVTTTLIIIGIIAITTRQIVYTAAPLAVEHITTEAVKSLRP